MIHRRFWPACCLVMLFPAALAAQSFTLQQVMSAPFQSELRASPAGQRFVWIAELGLFAPALEQTLAAPIQFVAHQTRHQIDGRHRLGLRLA